MMSYPKDVFSRMFGDTGKTNHSLLYPKEEVDIQETDDALLTNIFSVMLSRRSQRKFENREVEDSKVEMRPDIKKKLVDASNKQPYVNAPVVLIFSMNPERIKMNFPPHILKKFSLQDATLAAAYAQLAAHALGLSSIWIGMIDEEKIMATLNTKYVPSSILCLGYPQKILQPKPKRNLAGLIHEI
jgi:FMN reductase [NAD(P)H]